MNDIIVQFARLWGQLEATTISAADEDVSDALKGYDSEELLVLLKGWSQLPRPTADALEVGACNCPVV